jgi:hypothetical protein
MVNRKCLGSAALLVSALACARPAARASDTTATQPPASQDQDSAAIERLEQLARGLAHTDKCATLAQCRTAPVGHKACGGPRYYLTYCAASTDTVALTRTLARISEMEDAYNKKWRIMSTCQLSLPPKLRVSAGSCREEGGVAPVPR